MLDGQFYNAQITYHACLWIAGENWRTQRKPSPTQEEHANTTQKSLPGLELKPF